MVWLAYARLAWKSRSGRIEKWRSPPARGRTLRPGPDVVARAGERVLRAGGRCNAPAASGTDCYQAWTPLQASRGLLAPSRTDERRTRNEKTRASVRERFGQAHHPPRHRPRGRTHLGTGIGRGAINSAASDRAGSEPAAAPVPLLRPGGCRPRRVWARIRSLSPPRSRARPASPKTRARPW